MTARQPGGCHDESCITCSDAAVEVSVVRLLPGGLALVDTGHGEEEVSVALITARPGERILVHAGEAIAVAGTGSGEGAGGESAAEMASLYPFLYSGGTDLDAVLEQVRASTIAKAHEVIELRRRIATRDAERLARCAADAAAAFAAGGRMLAFGNGGSATDAQQLATLLLYPAGDAQPLPALALSNDTAVVTALCNDIGVDVVFARQLAALGTSNDIVVGLSTSGNSANLLRAFDAAKKLGMLTIGLAGYDGGKMAELDSIDYLFVAPSASVHRIQEAQTTVYHVWWQLVQAALANRGVGHVPGHSR
jgi:D-sedoheptulose 7-phosphate isomerase